MMRVMITGTLAGLLSLATLACEVNDADGDATTNTSSADTSTTNTGAADTSVATDTNVAGTTYRAIFLDDPYFDRCATSGSGAHGADIDAIGLFDPSQNAASPDLVGYADTVTASHADATTQCSSYGFDDPTEVYGPPDGDLTEKFYSLSGGWLIAEFSGGAELQAGDEVTVYEIDDSFCGGAACVGSEAYDVYIATDLDCVNTANFRSACMVKMTGSDGALGTANVELSGF